MRFSSLARPSVRWIAVALAVALPARALAVDSHPVLGTEPSVEALLAAGLDHEAERRLRADLAHEDEAARIPLAHLLLREGRTAEAGELLRDAKPAAAEAEFLIFTRARIHELGGEHAEAADAYLRSAATEPLLADHAMYRAGLALARLERNDEATLAFEAAGTTARVARLAEMAYFRAAGLALEAGHAPKAEDLLEHVPSRSSIARADRFALEARCARARADTVREEIVLRALVDSVPASAAALEATERLAVLRTPTLAERFTFAEVALANRHGSRAEEEIEAARTLLGEKPSDEDEGRARVLAGRAKMVRREYSAARREFAEVPKGARLADRAAAALDAARCLWRLGQIDACLVECDAIVRSALPESTRAIAAWEAAREAKDDRRWKDAARRFGEFRRQFPQHESATEALWQQGRALSEVGDGKASLDVFAELAALPAGSPRRDEARFWSARVLFAAGDTGRACEHLAALTADAPDSYWAHRAREVASERCGVPRTQLPEIDAAAWLGETADAAGAEARAMRESDPFRRARVLAAVDLSPEAEAELAGLRGSSDSDAASLFTFAETAWSIGVPREAMRAVSSLRRVRDGDVMSGELPAGVARLLYPVAHLESVQRWASENDLDPLFVFAVMREESWLDADAVSSAGARGLLQIMPATGFDLARRAGVREFSPDDLFRPEINVRLGSRYLRELLDAYDGEPLLALAAYNAGEVNATRWRAEGSFDRDEYVAGITFQETHGYVQKVMRTWAIYRTLWSDTLAQRSAGEETRGVPPSNP